MHVGRTHELWGTLFFLANVSGLGGDLVGKREPGVWEKLCLCKIP